MNVSVFSALAIFLFLNLSAAQESELVDVVVASVYEGGVDDHTCKRVMSFAPEKMTFDECLSKAKEVNIVCETLARQHIKSVLEEDETRKLVGILMVCPVAKILDYPIHIIDGEIKIEFPQ